MTPVIVIVTGGRTYSNRGALYAALDSIKSVRKLFHGACPVDSGGADWLADDWARLREVPCELFPPDPRDAQKRFYRRNLRMVNAAALDDCKALCVAFTGGRGTAQTMQLADDAGIEVWRPGKTELPTWVNRESGILQLKPRSWYGDPPEVTAGRDIAEAHAELDLMGATKLDAQGKPWSLPVRVRDLCVKASQATASRNEARRERDEANAEVKRLLAEVERLKTLSDSRLKSWCEEGNQKSATIDKLQQELDTRRVPVQGTAWIPRASKPSYWKFEPGTIAWEEHVEAWRAYDRQHRNGQSAARIAERGGFGREELRAFLGHEPKTFKPLEKP